MNLIEVPRHPRHDGLTRHADIAAAVLPLDEIDVKGRSLLDELERECNSICLFRLMPVVNALKVFGVQTLQNGSRLVAPGEDAINPLISV